MPNRPVPDERLGGQPARARRRAAGLIALALLLCAVALLSAVEAGFSRPVIQTQHLRIQNTRFVRPDGSPFAWRGITAFRLLEMEAAGKSGEVDASLRWAASQQLTVVRVLTMAKHLFELPPERGVSALEGFLSRAARHGMFVEVVALADTASYPVDLEKHVRRVGEIAAHHSNALVEIANEPYHATQKPELHHYEVLQALRKEIPTDVPVALGAAGYPEVHIAGDFVTFHSSRSPAEGGWGSVRDLKIGVEFLRKAGKPVVDDEPIGAGQKGEPGRRDDNPERFRAHALLAGLLGLHSTFHYEGGLQGRLPAGRELESFNAWREGVALAGDGPRAIPRITLLAGPAPARANRPPKRGGAYAIVDGDRAWVLVYGDGAGATEIKWLEGWKPGLAKRWPGMQFIAARRR